MKIHLKKKFEQIMRKLIWLGDNMSSLPADKFFLLIKSLKRLKCIEFMYYSCIHNVLFVFTLIKMFEQLWSSANPVDFSHGMAMKSLNHLF